jgi:chromate reductase
MGLLRAAKANLPADVTMEFAEIHDLPFLSQDLEANRPEQVLRVLAQFEKADALVLSCPEYNYSIAPALKNALDWASRDKERPLLANKPVAILGAGGGMGTSRAQYHLRQVCVICNLLPLNKPEVFANAFAGGFDAEGNLTDERIAGLVREQMAALAAACKK